MVVGSSRPICAQTRGLLSTATNLFPLTPWKAEENFEPKYTKDKIQSVDVDDSGPPRWQKETWPRKCLSLRNALPLSEMVSCHLETSSKKTSSISPGIRKGLSRGGKGRRQLPYGRGLIWGEESQMQGLLFLVYLVFSLKYVFANSLYLRSWGDFQNEREINKAYMCISFFLALQLHIFMQDLTGSKPHVERTSLTPEHTCWVESSGS